MERKKILIVTNTLSHGGAQRVAVRLANALSVRHEVYLAYFSKEINYVVSDRVRTIDIGEAMRIREVRRPFRLINYQFARIRGFAFFSRFRLKERPDATISFLHRPDMLNILAPSPGLRVLSERNNPRMKDKVYFLNSRIMFTLADRVVFQSETVRNMFPGAIRRKGTVIPNPVEITCRATEPVGHKVVAVGRLHSQKNFPLLFRAFLLFSKDHPEHTLHIYGEGDDIDKLRSLVRDLSLQEKVFFEGFQDDVHMAIRDAEMFVMSSDYEGMPNALLEALMMGLPCISTLFEFSSEFFSGEGSEACLLTPVGDEKALSEAMSSLADDPVQRRNLARKGAEFAQKFSIDQVIPLWESIL